MLYSIILASTLEGGIGYNNNIPWNIHDETNLFKKITTETKHFKKNALIMGRKTWESLNYKPLKNRLNIVITSNNNFVNSDNVKSFSNIKNAFEYCEKRIDIYKVFVIGGKMIYDLCFNRYSDNIENVYISIINKFYTCNTKINLKNILKNYEADIHSVIFHPHFLHMKMAKKIPEVPQVP
jgi:dihydrofolate reductase